MPVEAMTTELLEDGSLLIPVAPVAKPRMTQRDKWAKRPIVQKYHQFKDDMRLQVKGTLDPRFDVIFWIPMPQSWPTKKMVEMAGKPHQARPDIDNYLKALMDTLCEDDSHIYDAHAMKYWAYEGKIQLKERGQ